MRKIFSSPVRVCFILLTLIIQILWEFPVLAGTVLDRLEASVNSSLILTSDAKKFRETSKLRAQLDPLFAGTSVAEKGPNASNGDVIDFLINEKLMTQQFPVTDTEVEQEINSIQANNRLDRTALKSALSDQGFKFDDYFELIRTGASKRNLIDRDIRTKVVISDDDIKNYFYNHYTRNPNTPRAYHLGMISVSSQNYKSLNAAKDVILRAMKALKTGDSFEEVAKRFSDGGSAQVGGDLGVLTDDQMSPVIRDQVKKLKIGDTSEIFGGTAAKGFYILKLKDIKTNDSERLSQMKEEIRNQLAAGEYQHQISLWLDRQRQGAFIHRAGEAAVAGLPLTK